MQGTLIGGAAERSPPAIEQIAQKSLKEEFMDNNYSEEASALPGAAVQTAPGSPEQGTRLAVIVMIVGCVLWGSGMAVGKIAVTEYHPLFLVCMRMLLAALVLTPFILVAFCPIKIYSRRDLGLLVLLSLCDPVTFFAFEAMALKYTSASQASMVWALNPLISTMAGWLILKEKTTPGVLLCFLAAMGGVVLLTAAGGVSESAPNPVLGNIFEVCSLCGGAGFVVILRFLRGRYPVPLVLWFQSLIASAIFLPMLGLDAVELPSRFAWEPFIAVLYLGICITVGAQGCSAYALARIPVPRFSSFLNLIPIFGIILSMLLLGESMLPLQWVACALVLGAVILSQRFQK